MSEGLVDSFSMRGFVPSEGVTAHDHFFGTFAKFGGTDPRHTGEFLHEVATRAAAQNEQYLELMETPTWHRLNDITKGMAWRDDLGALRLRLPWRRPGPRPGFLALRVLSRLQRKGGAAMGA